MNETSKALVRRLHQPAFALRYFAGVGLDIGSGNDPLRAYTEFFPLCHRIDDYDQIVNPAHDAQTLPGIPNATYDFIHSSHCLEHVADPAGALWRWLEVVKPGGYLVVTVPDEDLYERGYWPSRGNADHKRTFTICKDRSWSPVSVGVAELLCQLRTADLAPPFDILKLEQLHGTYLWTLGVLANGVPVDQTTLAVPECAIEIVLRRWTDRDIRNRGRRSHAAPAAPEGGPLS